VKRTRRGESTGALIYIHMGTIQGNFPSSYLYLKLAKCHVSCFIFIFYGFSSTKLENRRAEQVLPGVGVWHQWEGRGG
jgi:hypothetical protein